jgi:hypothetical protein
MEKNYLSRDNLYRHFIIDYVPIALCATVLAPLERIKIILQTYKLMSLQEHDKNLRLPTLTRSNITLIRNIKRTGSFFILER